MTKDEALAYQSTGIPSYYSRHPLDDRARTQKALDVLAARVRELERGCDTCEHLRTDAKIDLPERRWCSHLSILARGKYAIYCTDVGGRCGSWLERKNEN